MLLLQILRNLLILNIGHHNPVSRPVCLFDYARSVTQSLSQSVPEAAAAAASSDSRRNGFPWAASHLFNMYRIRELGSPFGIPLTVDCFRIMQAPSTRPPLLHHFRLPYSKHFHCCHCHKYLNLCLLPLWVIRESICSSAEANVGHFPGKCLLFPVGDDKDWDWGFCLLFCPWRVLLRLPFAVSLWIYWRWLLCGRWIANFISIRFLVSITIPGGWQREWIGDLEWRGLKLYKDNNINSLWRAGSLWKETMTDGPPSGICKEREELGIMNR